MAKARAGALRWLAGELLPRLEPAALARAAPRLIEAARHHAKVEESVPARTAALEVLSLVLGLILEGSLAAALLPEAPLAVAAPLQRALMSSDARKAKTLRASLLGVLGQLLQLSSAPGAPSSQARAAASTPGGAVGLVEPLTRHWLLAECRAELAGPDGRLGSGEVIQGALQGLTVALLLMEPGEADGDLADLLRLSRALVRELAAGPGAGTQYGKYRAALAAIRQLGPRMADARLLSAPGAAAAGAAGGGAGSSAAAAAAPAAAPAAPCAGVELLEGLMVVLAGSGNRDMRNTAEAVLAATADLLCRELLAARSPTAAAVLAAAVGACSEALVRRSAPGGDNGDGGGLGGSGWQRGAVEALSRLCPAVAAFQGQQVVAVPGGGEVGGSGGRAGRQQRSPPPRPASRTGSRAMEDEDDVFYDADGVEEQPEEPPGPSDPSGLWQGSAYALHKAAFENDVEAIRRLVRQLPASELQSHDCHGNTPLHVAALRGHAAAVGALLDAGHAPGARSSRGWSPLDEALAARATPAARLLQRQLLAEGKAAMKAKRAALLESMRGMPDYSLQLKWQLGSAVPGLGLLLRRYAPHDTYTVWKVGSRLRVDGSLMGVDTKSLVPEWKRGHFSIVVDGSPAGVAAAAEAAAAAVADATAAAEARARERDARRAGRRRPGDEQQQQQQQQQGGEASGSGSAAGASSSSGARRAEPAGDDEFYDADEAPDAAAPAAAGSSSGHAGGASSSRVAAGGASSSSSGTAAGGSSGGGGGPRLLFLNHGKGSWVDLSADKKALKLEGQGEEEELEAELAAAMDRDVGKTRLKPREFKFAPVKGWLGGVATERVEGWSCTVYEATGKLLAVSTSKARLHLPPAPGFADYLAAAYEADAVTETLIDPLAPGGPGTDGVGGGDGSGDGGAAPRGSDGGMAAHDAADYAALTWQDGEQEPAGGGRRRRAPGARRRGGGGGSSGGGGDSSDGGAAAAGGGRLLKARCWMAQSFPMSLSQLLPLLDVIGAANKHVAKAGRFLAKWAQLDAFPVKLQVPIIFTVYLLLSCKAFTRLTPGGPDPPPGDDFFAVPPHYRRKLLAEVMDKAAASMLGVSGAERERAGSSGGGFYGGDAGEDDLLLDLAAGGGDEDDEGGAYDDGDEAAALAALGLAGGDDDDDDDDDDDGGGGAESGSSGGGARRRG
ncbi:ankrd13c [Scenedesmus sp. PABB004]|nr:ankrd13c [Scenedesmus sp. PABB004]